MVDNVNIDGALIGHTSDTDLMTLANGSVTFTGTTVVPTADINGVGFRQRSRNVASRRRASPRASHLDVRPVSRARHVSRRSLHRIRARRHRVSRPASRETRVIADDPRVRLTDALSRARARPGTSSPDRKSVV